MQTIASRQIADTAIRAACEVLVNIAGSDFATNYGTYTAYALREYKADIAADILKAMTGRTELQEWETGYLCHEGNWPRLEGFKLVNNPTGEL